MQSLRSSAVEKKNVGILLVEVVVVAAVWRARRAEKYKVEQVGRKEQE